MKKFKLNTLLVIILIVPLMGLVIGFVNFDKDFQNSKTSKSTINDEVKKIPQNLNNSSNHLCTFDNMTFSNLTVNMSYNQFNHSVVLNGTINVDSTGVMNGTVNAFLSDTSVIKLVAINGIPNSIVMGDTLDFLAEDTINADYFRFNGQLIPDSTVYRIVDQELTNNPGLINVSSLSKCFLGMVAFSTTDQIKNYVCIAKNQHHLFDGHTRIHRAACRFACGTAAFIFKQILKQGCNHLFGLCVGATISLGPVVLGCILVKQACNFLVNYLTDQLKQWLISKWQGTEFVCAPCQGILCNIRIVIEGFYNPVTESLIIKDTIRAYLRSATSPYAKVDSTKEVIDTLLLDGDFHFKNTPNGNYYLQVSHRNSIETWSSGGIALSNDSVKFYDFSTSASQAFGNNMILKGTKYCIYSGDVNQDEVIDISDLGLVDNDAYNFITGYVNSDVNGDGVVDLSDAAIVDNNAFNFVGVVKP